MILNALCDYYDIIASDEQSGISSYGYEKTDFHYILVLSEEGKLSGITPLVSDKKKDKPMSAIMPKSMKISGIAASPVCDNMAYLLGVTGKKGEEKNDTRKFEAAKELHLRLFKCLASKEAVAVKRFFENWKAEKAWQNEFVLEVANEKGNEAFTGKAVFRLKGETKFIHDCEEIKGVWLQENNSKNNEDEEYTSQCAITGKIEAIAKLHTQLSGVKGTQSTGASLICFNKNADESYNLKQSYNSHVSKTTAFKYTTILQHLLNSTNNKLLIGDDTTVFWAHSADKVYEEVAASFYREESNGSEADRRTEEIVKNIIEHGLSGIPEKINIDSNVDFYTLGLAPNAGRISIRYFYHNSFNAFCQKIKRYHDETKICGKHDLIRVGRLLFSTVSTNSSDKKVNPLLGGAVMRAILSGSQYPQLLFNQVILRIKAEAKIGQARAAALKACLIRNKKEEILPMLNEESRNEAYVLGRVFAILEMIQKNAAGGSLNATIKDKYFSTACSTPALVFPNLLKLAQHHLSKIEGSYWSKQLGDCLILIEGITFPKVQNMDDQGSFILGYYQQTQKNYTKKQ